MNYSTLRVPVQTEVSFINYDFWHIIIRSQKMLFICISADRAIYFFKVRLFRPCGLIHMPLLLF